MKRRLQFQQRIAQLQFIAVAQQKMPIIEHPQISRPIMQRPKRLRGNGPLRKRQHLGANLPLVSLDGWIALAADQPRRMKREKQPVLVQKIERNVAFPLPLVDRSRGEESQWLNGD